MYKKTSGFSLVELLVVVIIIGILASLSTASYVRYIARGRDQQRKADLIQISAALERYRADNGHYPFNDVGNCDSSIGSFNAGFNNCGVTVHTGAIGDWVVSPVNSVIRELFEDNYLDELPYDPINDAEHYYGIEMVCGIDNDSACGRSGLDCAPGVCCAYELATTMESGDVFRICEDGLIQE